MGIKLGILGATGYTGSELLRLLVNHGGIQISWLTSEKFAGQKISQVFPHLSGFLDNECVSVRKIAELEEVDLVYSCLPRGTSKHFVAKMIKSGARVIDFSSDYRFSKDAVYGLPEINKEEIIDANLVANPGCYATSVILGLAPLAAEGLLIADSVIADIKSGLSGGGRAPSLAHHFSEANQDVNIGLGTAQEQKTEMEEKLSQLSGSKLKVSFIPHTVPLDRGILATIYCKLKKNISIDKVNKIYRQFYDQKKFIRVLESGQFPSTKIVRYSNMCDIGMSFQDDVFVVVVAIDNLGKGASGQAVQNMNLMLDFPEDQGLTAAAILP